MAYGGEYIPTRIQYETAFELINLNPTPEQERACNLVIYGYLCNEKILHDHIHVINEFIRNKNI